MSKENHDNSEKFFSTDEIERQILTIRGQHVLLSQQLARLYGMKVKAFNQTVRRNPKFFPEGSIFQLSEWEFFEADSYLPANYWGGIRRANPYAFTLDAIIPLQYLLRRHGHDGLDQAVFRAFMDKRKRLEIGGGERIQMLDNDFPSGKIVPTLHNKP